MCIHISTMMHHFMPRWLRLLIVVNFMVVVNTTHAHNTNIDVRELQTTTGGISPNVVCMDEAFGGGLGCTANDIKITTAVNITILDDGCQYIGDTVQFSANFVVESTADRFDIGLWFATDGDPNADGAMTGQCTVATPYYNSDGDFCGDLADGFNPQSPRFTITTAGTLLVLLLLNNRIKKTVDEHAVPETY